jgi:UDP-2,3-diacylglucosamine pyrophosphatase LpxH
MLCAACVVARPLRVSFVTIPLFRRGGRGARRHPGRRRVVSDLVVRPRVKSAVSFISDFEQHLRSLAVRRGCDGVICGHIHKAEDRRIGRIRYLNSGDWVESLTALVEEADGSMRVVGHPELLARVRAARQAAVSVPA